MTANMDYGSAPMESSKVAPTFAELFDGTRDSLRRLAESWHQARGATPTEYLELFASLTADEEIAVMRAVRAIKPSDGEPTDWLVSRRAVSVQEALDAIQGSRGRPPIMPMPPPYVREVGYVLSDGDKLEAARIANVVVKFFGPSATAVTVRTEVDRDGWHWVYVTDMDGLPLKMGTGGFQVGAVQCSHAAEATAMASAISHAIDTETRRVAVGGVKFNGGKELGQMPRHMARRLGIHPAADAHGSAPISSLEETESCANRLR